MKAKLLKSLRINGKSVKANGADPVIADLSDAEFKRLAAMGAVIEPTEKELKLAAIDENDSADGDAAPKAAEGSGRKTATKTAAPSAAVDL